MIVLAESGSTKTDWRILGKEYHSFETIGLNPYFVDSDSIKVELQPYLTSKEVTEVHFYGTGITDDSKGEIIAEGIRRTLGYAPKIYTYSDVIAAARSLFGDDKGIACILGTGSNSCFWDGSKIDFQVPPLGFWLGDEGSGGHLGKSLIQAYLHKELPQDIRDRFDLKYGAKDRLEIIKHAYQMEKPNKYFASYCPFMLENADDSFIQGLIRDSFKQFIEKYLIKYPNVKEASIGAVGSVAHYFERILKEVFEEYGIKLTKVVQKPIDALVDYHSK